MKETDFSVIHLSTGHIGGAGLAARRLNQQLNELNINSTFYALQNKDFDPSLNENSIQRTIVKRFFSKIVSLGEGKLSSKVFFSPLSINSLPKNFGEEIVDKNKTILHIHNWFNLLNFKQIYKLNNMGFPIVITLHDQRTMTGGCHYALECNNFEKECADCPELRRGQRGIPQLAWRQAKHSIEKIDSKFALIAPSNWMLQEARRSSLLKNLWIEFIPNTLGPFFPKLELHGRANSMPLKLGIASMNSDSYIKGGDLVKKLEIEVESRKLPIEFIYLNSFAQDDSGTRSFWQNIDYLLVLSRAENSPNVIHEAKQNGIPIIASNVGGITELLSKDYDIGLDAGNLNPAKITEVFENILKSQKPLLQQIQMQNEFNHYTKGSLSGHINLYNLITKSS